MDKHTLGVVPTFSRTHTDLYEFVGPLARALDRLQQQTAIEDHDDAAIGASLPPSPSLRSIMFFAFRS